MLIRVINLINSIYIVLNNICYIQHEAGTFLVCLRSEKGRLTHIILFDIYSLQNESSDTELDLG